MSIEVMSKVLRTSKLPEAERFALLVLADFGNDDGIGIYASHHLIGQRMNVARRSVIRRLNNLKAVGVLWWSTKGHKHKTGMETNEYTINVGAIGKEDLDKLIKREGPEDKAKTRLKDAGDKRKAKKGVVSSVAQGVVTSEAQGVVTSGSHKPLVDPSVESSSFPTDVGTGLDSNQNIQASSVTGEEDHLDQMNPPAAAPAAPRPARRPTNTADTQKGDDLVMNHLKRKAQATLGNWDIDPANVEAALGSLKHEEGKKITAAAKAIEFAVTEVVGELGLRCWPDRTYCLHLLKLDVKLDELQAVVKADAGARLAEFASLKGYGPKHAYQAMIIHKAAENKGKAKQANPNRDVLMKSPEGTEYIVKGFQVEDALGRGFKFVKGE